MDTTRFALRLLFRIERVLDRLNIVLSVIYVSLVVGLISVTCFVYWTTVYGLVHATLPSVQANLHTVISVYLMFSVITNYVGCLITGPGSPPSSMTDPEWEATKYGDEHGYGDESTMTRSESWRYCTICRGPKPPRTHHCSVCKACYYKLCHHCPALGKCVGRDNYPFFWRFVMGSWVGALFMAGTCGYIRRMGKAGDEEELLFFMTIGSCAVGVAVGVLGAWHMYLVVTGQTTIEWLENVKVRRSGTAPEEWGRWGGAFNKGLRDNMSDVFGELPWYMSLFWPVGRKETSASRQELQETD